MDNIGLLDLTIPARKSGRGGFRIAGPGKKIGKPKGTVQVKPEEKVIGEWVYLSAELWDYIRLFDDGAKSVPDADGNTPGPNVNNAMRLALARLRAFYPGGPSKAAAAVRRDSGRATKDAERRSALAYVMNRHCVAHGQPLAELTVKMAFNYLRALTKDDYEAMPNESGRESATRAYLFYSDMNRAHRNKFTSELTTAVADGRMILDK